MLCFFLAAGTLLSNTEKPMWICFGIWCVLGLFEKRGNRDPIKIPPRSDIKPDTPVAHKELPLLWKIFGLIGGLSVYWFVLGLWLPVGMLLCLCLMAWFVYDAFESSRLNKSPFTILSLH
jgi:hypothetical protein